MDLDAGPGALAVPDGSMLVGLLVQEDAETLGDYIVVVAAAAETSWFEMGSG